MYKKNDNFTTPAKPWQPRWWREDPERWRWAGTVAIVVLLTGVFAYRNPDIWQNTVPPQLAEAEIAPDTYAGQPEPALRQPSAPPLEADARTGTEPADEAQLATQETVTAGTTTEQASEQAEDTEPAGMQQLEAATAVAVSTPPASWLLPGYGAWTRAYGYALDPTQGDYRFHHGCDMELAAGSPVFAAASGKVLLTAEDAAWGGVVIVEHGGGWRSVYKCVQPEVSVGAALVAGEQIGLVLASPPAEQAQSSHLHFELERDGEKQNPITFL